MWALALPFGFGSDAGRVDGALAVAREDRAFREDEEAVMLGLVERARQAAADIIAHQMLREQALTDALTRLGNRRKLAADLEERLAAATASEPLVLMMFDLDGFKSYNDTFGHLAGDALLARLGRKLAAAVSALRDRLPPGRRRVLRAADGRARRAATASWPPRPRALEERGENFDVGGLLRRGAAPARGARSLDYALQLADERMYAPRRPAVAWPATRRGTCCCASCSAKQPCAAGPLQRASPSCACASGAAWD